MRSHFRRSLPVSIVFLLLLALCTVLPAGAAPRPVRPSHPWPTARPGAVPNGTSCPFSARPPTRVATIPVGSCPIGVEVNPPIHRAYVTNSGDNTVAVINTITNRVITTIPLALPPRWSPSTTRPTASMSRTSLITPSRCSMARPIAS